MPLAFLVAGLVLLVAGIRNKQSELIQLLRDDFSGSNNFAFWIVALGAVGALGYVKELKPVSNVFLTLVFVVLFVTEGRGFFDQFSAALKQTQTSTGVTS